MPEDKKWEIADAADMIVSGFAFKRCGETIQIVNLNKNEPHVIPKMVLRIKFITFNSGSQVTMMKYIFAIT